MEPLGRVTSMLYDAAERNFTVAVRALGDGVDVFSSKLSESEEYVYLEKILDFQVDEGVISWDPVEYATSYEVMLNGVKKRVTLPEFKDIPTDVSNRIQIKPIGTDDDIHYFSEWSDERNVKILRTPTPGWNNQLSLVDGEAGYAFEWTQVAGNVAGYTVKIVTPDGQSQEIGAGAEAVSVAYAFLDTGVYKVSVKANAEYEEGLYDSAYSKAIDVIRLAPPTTPNSSDITSNSHDLSSGFTVHFNKVFGANGYWLWKDGYKQDGITPQPLSTDRVDISVFNVTNQNQTITQEFEYAIQSVGSNELKTDSSGKQTVTLSSLTASNAKFKIHVLPTPTGLSFNGSMATWNTVEGSSGYIFAGWGKDQPVVEAEYDLMSSVVEANEYDVKVCAQGNGHEVLPSMYTASQKVIKLKRATNLRVITSGESEGRLEWDGPAIGSEGVGGYNAVISGYNEPVPADKIDDFNQYVTTDTVQVYIVTLAKEETDPNTNIHYITSEGSAVLKLTKLKAPIFPKNNYFNETELLWNEPTNMNESFAPKYEVWDVSDDTKYNGDYKGGKFNMSDFPAGRYSFKVRAIGDGVNYINSDFSEPCDTLTKLETPTLKVSLDQLSYTWTAVRDAQRYIIYVGGEKAGEWTHEGGKTYTYVPDKFLSATEYKVTLVAVSDAAMDSNPEIITQNVVIMSSPTISIGYTEKSYSPNGRIFATISEDIKNNPLYKYITGFRFTLGDASKAVTMKELNGSLTYTFDDTTSTGTFGVKVSVLSNMFAEDDNPDDKVFPEFYIESRPCTEQKITLLGTVGSTSVSVSKDLYLTWGTVSNAVSFDVTLVYKDGTSDKKVGLSAASRELSLTQEQLNNLDYAIIQAKGNGTTIIDGAEYKYDR